MNFRHCKIILPLLAVLLLFGCGDGANDPNSINTREESRRVREAFNAYRQAVLDAKGSEAANFIDSDSLAYFQRIRNLAFDGLADEIKALPAADKMLVLITRLRVSADDLQTLDGRGLFEYAANQGWIGKQSVKHSDLGSVKIVDADTATGELLIDKKETPLTMKFTRAADGWKLNLPHINAATQEELAKTIAASEQDENEFVVNIIAFSTGQEVRESIWEPRNFEKRTKFDVMLTDAGQKKIQLLKTVREITGLALTEAKSLVDNTPSFIKQGVSRADAEAMIKKINEQGGTAEIK